MVNDYIKRLFDKLQSSKQRITVSGYGYQSALLNCVDTMRSGNIKQSYVDKYDLSENASLKIEPNQNGAGYSVELVE